jgi:hypothetical protein
MQAEHIVELNLSVKASYPADVDSIVRQTAKIIRLMYGEQVTVNSAWRVRETLIDLEERNDS